MDLLTFGPPVSADDVPRRQCTQQDDQGERTPHPARCGIV